MMLYCFIGGLKDLPSLFAKVATILRQCGYSLYIPLASGVSKFGIHLDLIWKYI